MKVFGTAIGCILIATANVARGDCDELQAISLPLTEDTTVTLTTGDAPCDNIGEGELQEFVIEGGSLTLTGPSTAAFVNLRFKVMDGASLIFDFDRTEFGPNFDFEMEDDYGDFMLEVMEGGYAEFSGEMVATEVENYRSVFYNAGTMEFKSDAHFYDVGTNVFRENVGKLRFRGDAKFENVIYLGVYNAGGTVRIAGESLFEDIGRSFDGARGAAFSNVDDGIAIFDGDAVFRDVTSDSDGGALYNEGKMKFYSKARFFDSRTDEDGGGLYNNGALTFFGAVQIIGNKANENGGGLGVGGGGSVSFRRWTTIQNNNATGTGGAMIIGATNYADDASTDPGSSVEFRKPTKVRITGNRKTGSELGCNNIYLDENSELIGYESDGDICDES